MNVKITDKRWNAIRRTIVATLRDNAIAELKRECEGSIESNFEATIRESEDGLCVAYADDVAPTTDEINDGLDDAIETYVDTYVDVIVNAAIVGIRDATTRLIDRLT